MINVFVESNWVYEYCAPAHRRTRNAEALVVRAEAGEIRLLVPAICLREGAAAVRTKCQPKLTEVREYRRLAASEGRLPRDKSDVVVEFLDHFDRHVRDDLAAIDERLDALLQTNGVEVFGLDDAILSRVLELRKVPDVAVLKAFDESILAAVLVKAEALRSRGVADIRFCCLDEDLRPWTKKGQPKPGLTDLYRAAGVTFVDDLSV
jgi:hypothetical protein